MKNIFSMQLDGRQGKLVGWIDGNTEDCLKKCNLFDNLANDRLQWEKKIYVAYPNMLGQDDDDDDD